LAAAGGNIRQQVGCRQGKPDEEQAEQKLHAEQKPSPLNLHMPEFQADPVLKSRGRIMSWLATCLFTLSLLGCVVTIQVLAGRDHPVYIGTFQITSRHDLNYNKMVWATIVSLSMRFWDSLWSFVVDHLIHMEQHVLQRDYDQAKAVKVIIVKSLNVVLPFGYVTYIQPSFFPNTCGDAGYADCAGLLQKNILIAFVTYILFGLGDMFMPYFAMKYKIWHEHRALVQNHPGIDPKDCELGFKEMQAKMDTYSGDSASSDFHSIIFPMGFLTLYSGVLPFLSILLFLQVVLQSRVDSWKLCYVYKRCEPTSSCGIGIWNDVLSTLNFFSTANCIGLLLFQCPDFVEHLRSFSSFQYYHSSNFKVLLFFAIQNVCLILKTVFDYLVPDIPSAVLLNQQQQELQRQRLFEQDDKVFSLNGDMMSVGDAEALPRFDPLKRTGNMYQKALI